MGALKEQWGLRGHRPGAVGPTETQAGATNAPGAAGRGCGGEMGDVGAQAGAIREQWGL